MIKKSSKVEDPISLALDFYNTDVVIDENVGDWNVEVFDIDLYCDIMAENGLNILYARDLEWGEFDGLE